ncbi:carbamoyltransferase C-terminal domain-containing protein [Aphanizomenon flos-aquae NRERC-008]|uniref:Carbamoyltransferase n=1 Tax=Aphanizomenon flos-aquae FACHB-1249 TaxID=2692889 RepID=A0ABR8ILD1_APHFL|nr:MULTISPECIES: carbamoyltransferase C-terminal domain-containing protein [Aphanizomenon]MBD2391947.1 carbamoyltransferase [Aphanizomenon flos-aquae FACHB-1171]MBD2558847.1 carbamoyltransferase [Aphanizomenon flos-aquae FACHB-1290]MBD2633519.1 carbamoyltransferase [Aphanizomenon sp. FACHB-1399]MBD2641493.1 carbamoyltransferase [Aphanizomenon sp. FACHB-1401]MBD2658531.1 carbamoyltransferase [Aphanizomenon flos-aquae FACHB-1265]
MNILGINAYHGDASASLVQNGQLVAAIEEERFNRVKHWAGFPAESIRYCLKIGGISAKDLDHVALSFNPKANLNRKLLFTLKQRPSLSSLLDRFNKQSKSANLLEQLAAACNCQPQEITAPIHTLEHHTTHLASSFFISPFEKAAILSIDGMGDFVSTLSAAGEGNHLEYFTRTHFPHSIGYLYNAITLYLGFPAYGDEYKVMGLAPYGEPEYLEAFRKIIFPKGDSFELNLDYFNHHEQGIAMKWDNGAPTVALFHSPELEKLLGPARQINSELTTKHQNIATSLQAITEEIIFHLLNQLYRRYPCENLCLTGGVAMNSVANGKITQNTPFKNAYIPLGAADNGTCIGAAFFVWNQILKEHRQFILSHAYWGSEFSGQECLSALQSLNLQPKKLEKAAMLNHIVDAICDGKVIGWFQGRMEFGARALGNRSLIADPRRADMRDIINLKIKFREKFRPFAPSILEEFVGEYFEIDEPVPFMEKVFKIRPEKREKIPAVTHVDGTGRLQSVSRHTNSLYWELINTFYQRTGIPLLLNTSLNENEPIVRTPQEAIQCFLRTNMDSLVLGCYYINRSFI